MNLQPIRGRARTGLPALLLGAALLFTTACSGSGGGNGGGSGGDNAGGGGKTGTEASKAVVSVKPDDGAKEVATSGVLKISSTGGKLSTVTVADTKGNAVEGKLADDGASWEPARHLASATEYKVHAVAKDEAGRESAKDTTFTTLTPTNTFVGHYTPEDGATVGVGMPVSINFTRGSPTPRPSRRPSRSPPSRPSRSRATGSATTASTSAPRTTGPRAPRSP